MQSTNIPSKIPLPFAYAAGGSYKNTIPVASQIGITNGKASLTDGFPPLTFQAISSGGVPPFGADFNGILNEITAIQQWQEAGGMFVYDSAFSTTIGGYPKGAILQAAAFGGLWQSTVENNTSNPDTGGAGWISLAFEGLQPITVTSADAILTPLQAAYPVVVVSGARTGNINIIFPNIVGEWIVQNNTTGPGNLVARTMAGTGVTLTAGQSTYIYGDGTNIYFADSSKVASFNGRTGTVNLNATDVTLALGYTPINPNQFVQSFTSNGYQILPSGLIIQWGNFTTYGDGSTIVYYPITFPNRIFSLSLNNQGWSGPGSSYNAGDQATNTVISDNNTSYFNARTNSTSINNQSSYIAIGY